MLGQAHAKHTHLIHDAVRALPNLLQLLVPLHGVPPPSLSSTPSGSLTPRGKTSPAELRYPRLDLSCFCGGGRTERKGASRPGLFVCAISKQFNCVKERVQSSLFRRFHQTPAFGGSNSLISGWNGHGSTNQWRGSLRHSMYYFPKPRKDERDWTVAKSSFRRQTVLHLHLPLFSECTSLPSAVVSIGHTKEAYASSKR